MTIFVNSDTRVIVQGMTGAEGRKHPAYSRRHGHQGRYEPRKRRHDRLSTRRATARARTRSPLARSRSPSSARSTRPARPPGANASGHLRPRAAKGAALRPSSAMRLT